MSAAIQGIYIALFGRPADPGGLAYWTEVTKGGADLSAMLSVLPNLTEYTARFEGQTPDQVITTVYQNLFGRAPDAEGLAFFKGQLASGAQTLATIAVNIMQGAQGDDKADVTAKVSAAELFTASLDTPEEIAAYQGADAAALAKKFLDTVDKDKPATPESVEKAAGAVVAGQDPTGGQAPNPGGGTGGGGGTPLPAEVIAINGAATPEATLAAIKQYANVLMGADAAGAFAMLPDGGGRQLAIALGLKEHIQLFGNFSSLSQVRTTLEFHTETEFGKFAFIRDVQGATTVDQMVAVLNEHVERLSDARRDLIDEWANSSSQAAQDRAEALEADPYTTVLASLAAKIDAGVDISPIAEDLLATPGLWGTTQIVNSLQQAIAHETAALAALNDGATLGELNSLSADLFDPDTRALFDEMPQGQGRQQAVALGVTEHINLFGAFTSTADAKAVVTFHTETEHAKFEFITSVQSANTQADMITALGIAKKLSEDRQDLIDKWSAADAPQAAKDRATELAQSDYTKEIKEIADAGALKLAYVADQLVASDTPFYGDSAIVGVIKSATAVLDGLGFVQASAGVGFEPTINLSPYLSSLLTDGRLTNDEFSAVVNLAGSEAKAFKLLWDHADDLYTVGGPAGGYYIEALNSFNIDVAIIYADYLKKTGQAGILSDIVKFTADGADEGNNPDRSQSMHHNILGNFDERTIDDRFGEVRGDGEIDFTFEMIIGRITEAGYGSAIGAIGNFTDGRPVYGGYEGTVPDSANAWDQQYIFGL